MGGANGAPFIRDGGKTAVARFEGTETAAPPRRCAVRWSRSTAALPPLEEGEYYHADLIGLPAVDRDGTPSATIIAVENFGAGDLLRSSSGGKRSLIPFREASPTSRGRQSRHRPGIPRLARLVVHAKVPVRLPRRRQPAAVGAECTETTSSDAAALATRAMSLTRQIAAASRTRRSLSAGARRSRTARARPPVASQRPSGLKST